MVVLPTPRVPVNCLRRDSVLAQRVLAQPRRQNRWDVIFWLELHNS